MARRRLGGVRPRAMPEGWPPGPPVEWTPEMRHTHQQNGGGWTRGEDGVALRTAHGKGETRRCNQARNFARKSQRSAARRRADGKGLR
jgi:hypothetical protein